MNDHAIHSAVSVFLAITGLAVLAVLVSNKAQTGSVLGAGGSALGNLICIAVSPITGSSCGGGVRLPTPGRTPTPEPTPSTDSTVTFDPDPGNWGNYPPVRPDDRTRFTG